jgi:hypothetical protein
LIALVAHAHADIVNVVGFQNFFTTQTGFAGFIGYITDNGFEVPAIQNGK